MMLFTWLALLGYPQGVLRLYRTCISTRLGIRLSILESMVLGWIDVSAQYGCIEIIVLAWRAASQCDVCDKNVYVRAFRTDARVGSISCLRTLVTASGYTTSLIREYLRICRYIHTVTREHLTLVRSPVSQVPRSSYQASRSSPRASRKPVHRGIIPNASNLAFVFTVRLPCIRYIHLRVPPHA